MASFYRPLFGALCDVCFWLSDRLTSVGNWASGKHNRLWAQANRAKGL